MFWWNIRLLCKCRSLHKINTFGGDIAPILTVICRRRRRRSALVFSFVRTMATASGSSDDSRPTNRLAQEKSPYLLQHCHNPVNWYPWGKEAFDKAKSEDKPIFLSVGYSTCHWCHVMERESFENEEIGKIMNEHFVNIKVDREERPDVDKVYMTFVQATSGHGGWPMSVWLTPDLKPIVGGTYFAPDDRYWGRPGFKSVLLAISGQWQQKRLVIEHQGSEILDALMQASVMKSTSGQTLPSLDCVDKAYSMLAKTYDDEFGGYGDAPKFPQPVNLSFMFRVHALKPNSDYGRRALEMNLFTLKMMANGGMHDHVAQGFHRYSTDKYWHVPHFEKMLYDQGQIAVSYLEAYQISKDEAFAETAKDIFQYVNRDLSDKEGGFYSAEDADSLPTHDATDKREGAFCVWTAQDIKFHLSKKIEGLDNAPVADIFCFHYGVKDDGNVDPYQDPHDELTEQNVLTVKGNIAETAQHFSLTVDKTKEILEKSRQILFKVRRERPLPHLDDKILTSWNGLMISGFAKGGQVFRDNALMERAIKAANFVKTHMYNEESGVLLRSSYAEKTKGTISQIPNPIEGFVDDYTSLIRGLLDLYEACFDECWLKWAEQLQTKQNELFWDDESGGYFTSSANDPSIVLRLKEDQDGAEPSANSVAASNLLRLSNFLNRPDLQEKAEEIFKVFAERLNKIPVAIPEMLCALMCYHQTPKQIIVIGDLESEDTRQFVDCIHSHFIPNKILIVTKGNKGSYLGSKLPVLNSLEMKEGKATAYVCENYMCSLPVTTVEDLEKVLTST